MDEISGRYVAGFFDADGSTAISRSKRKDGRVQWAASISICNLHKPTLDAIQERYGGTFTVDNRKEVRFGKRPLYRLQWTGNGSLRPLLEALLAYSRVKALQIRCIEEFLDTMTAGRAPISATREQRRTDLKATLNAANQGLEL